MTYQDRTDAGQKLAQKLSQYLREPNTLVLALPRGGVPVAYEVATQLQLPLDVFLVRKLGVPGQQELAMGAIASGGIQVLNEDVIRLRNITPQTLENVAKQEQLELQRREQAYRSGRTALQVRGKRIILIDDGLATGASMRAAIAALRQQRPSQIVVAVPVASEQTCREFQQEADAIVCAMTPRPFYGVGMWYEDFSQTTDDQVRQLLQKAATRELT